MITHKSLILELEEAMERGSNNRRIETLRRVADLFVTGADLFSEEQIRVFDDVIVRLAQEIETRARAELSRRLAPIENAPTNVIRMLAHDDMISVAEPVLSQSARLGEDDLVEIAKTKGQGHLLAISGRRQLSEKVTDVLVQRGDQKVMHKVADNDGANFSEKSFGALVDLAKKDEKLTEKIGHRSDVPPYLFRELLEQATELARQRILANAKPEMQTVVRHLLDKVSKRVGAESELVSRSYQVAQRYVQSLHQAGKLGAGELVEFAKSAQFEEMVAALSELCRIPLEQIDQLMHGDRIEPILILCRANRFEWLTVRSVIMARHGQRILSARELEDACSDYSKLTMATAQRVLRFWEVRGAQSSLGNEAQPASNSLSPPDKRLASSTA